VSFFLFETLSLINEENMKLPEEAINEFKQIYQKQNSEQISDDKANELANKLLNLFKLVYAPVERK